MLELLTTLAIVSLLIVISYPSYTQYMLKTRRTEAQIALLNLASALEHYYLLNNTYAGATLNNLAINKFLDSKNYRLQIENASGEDYKLSAIPEGTQKSDAVCGTLRLNSLGEKGVEGSGNVAACW